MPLCRHVVIGPPLQEKECSGLYWGLTWLIKNEILFVPIFSVQSYFNVYWRGFITALNASILHTLLLLCLFQGVLKKES